MRFPVLCLLLIVVTGCTDRKSAPTTPSTPASTPATPSAPAPPPPPPTSWRVSGQIVASHNGQPVAGATVALDGIAPETSQADGSYVLDTPEGANRRLVVAADGYQYRETFLRGGEIRSNVIVDLIPSGGSFPFWLYRQMARNGSEQPSNLQPVQHWTINPNIHLENRWRDTGAPISDSVLQYFVSEFQRVIPILSDGKLSVGRIDIGPEAWNFVPDYISVHFDHSGNWGYVGQNPGQVQFGTAAPCTSIMIIHELGHAMGYWHSNVTGTVMGGHVIASCNLDTLRPDEQLVARVLYSRPPGNVEPDRDPPGPFAYMQPGGSGPPQIEHCDDMLPSLTR